jgi:drug/metabolite transporter (DMT)-like permease
MEGIARVAVTKAGALTSVAPLFTLLFAWLIFHQAPTIWQISSLLPFFFGILLLTGNFKLKHGN